MPDDDGPWLPAGQHHSHCLSRLSADLSTTLTMSNATGSTVLSGRRPLGQSSASPSIRTTVRASTDDWTTVTGRYSGTSYQMVQLLYVEAMLAILSAYLLPEGCVARVQRRAYTKLHTRICKYWKQEAGQQWACFMHAAISVKPRLHNTTVCTTTWTTGCIV